MASFGPSFGVHCGMTSLTAGVTRRLEGCSNRRGLPCVVHSSGEEVGGERQEPLALLIRVAPRRRHATQADGMHSVFGRRGSWRDLLDFTAGSDMFWFRHGLEFHRPKAKLGRGDAYFHR